KSDSFDCDRRTRYTEPAPSYVRPNSRRRGAMDLRSACHRASWHPITSLINLRIAERGEGTPFELYPMRLDETRRDGVTGRLIGSALQHEVAHLDAARQARVGWLLRYVGGSALHDWRHKRPPALLDRFETLLGTIEPLLEGLALYCQLDFE